MFKRAKRLQLRNTQFVTRPYPSLECRKRRIALLEYHGKELAKAKFKWIGCGSWNCPVCQQVKALQVKYKLKEIIETNDLKYFLTLTLDPKKLTPDIRSEEVNNTHKYITKLFNHFTTILRRKTFTFYSTRYKKKCTIDLKSKEEKLKYVWVAEFQKETGNAHLHVLINHFLPVSVIREVWSHVGGGHIMWIEKVKSVKGISSYVTDYIVKGLKHPDSSDPLAGFKFFERRYAVSNSCIKPKKVGKPMYEGLTNSEMAYVLEADGLGWVYDELQNDKFEDKEIKFL